MPDCLRLHSLHLRNIKNVGDGTVVMPHYEGKESSILGIYGQNGSGKTAAVTSLRILQDLILSHPLPEVCADLIMKNEDSASLEMVLQAGDNSTLGYAVTFAVLEGRGACVVEEALTIRQGGVRKVLRHMQSDDEPILRPASVMTALRKTIPGSIQKLTLAKSLSLIQRTSFFFSEETYRILAGTGIDDTLWARAITAIEDFAAHSLFVIDDARRTLQTMNVVLPAARRHASTGAGEHLVPLREPATLPVQIFRDFADRIQHMNPVVSAIVPGLSVSVHEYGPQLEADGSEAIRFELLACRRGSCIPLRYESEGIVKIISLVSLLAAMFNDESVCVAVDELDANIYEYMLGEILAVLDVHGKGQLLFTSHNMRPLEVLSPQSIMFTTANSDNRYVRMNMRRNSVQNLRDSYLRAITLGGEVEPLCDETNAIDIRRAFSTCGDIEAVDPEEGD